ncbi:MAG: acetylacetone-cleaving protein [Pseudomonadota bacterium]
MSMPVHMETVAGRYVQMDEIPWVDFPDALSDGGIKWKLLNVAPEMGAWTAIFDCPKGSSFAPHVHIGPGEYWLTRGRMEVRGGDDDGGDTAQAPGYGYEACQAYHEKTYFPEDSEFYMTFLGPLNFIDPEGNTVALVTWSVAQAAWEAAVNQA